MRKTMVTTVGAALMAAGYLLAGGFFLQLGNPEASAEARKANAVITVKAAGCHDPAKAEVSATAVGVVNGQRRTLPVDVTRLGEPGMFAIARQWPAQGKWVIHLVGHSDGVVTSTLVAAGPEGIDRLHARSEMRAFAEADVEAMLR